MQTMASYKKKQNRYFVFGVCNSNVARGNTYIYICIYIYIYVFVS